MIGLNENVRAPTTSYYVEQEQRIKPDLTEVIEPEGYKQNAEQSDNSVWNKIHKQDK